MASSVSKSWFAVFNNPEEHGYTGTPVEICDKLREEWISSSPTRTGAWIYCISEDGLKHVHMVLEDTMAMRFSKIKKTYAVGMHFEETLGNKQQVEDYIEKRGKFEEKGEKVVYKCTHGEIVGAQGKRHDLEEIQEYIDKGLTPKQILSIKFSYYRYEGMIRKAYFENIEQMTPSVRPVKVIWHTGESGSGKSYSRISLEEEVGEENIFYLSDYTPNSLFDSYCGQAYLWIEDYKGEIRYGDFLRYLDVYKVELRARYSNAKAVWKEVHITSVLHPKGAYEIMVPHERRKIDSVNQLIRRIHCIRYHYKDEFGLYKYLDFSPEVTIEQMRRTANVSSLITIPVDPEEEELPF